MNKYLIPCLLVFLFFLGKEGKSQQRLTLYQVVQKAKNESPAALRGSTQKENRYWQYRTYLSDYKPQLVLDGSESYTHGIIPTVQPDGTYEFNEVHQNFGRLGLSLEQQIGITGSRLSLTSDLTRFDNFLELTPEQIQQGRTIIPLRYSGSPVYLGIEQPLFRFNPLRWNRKIEPLRFEESKKAYVEELEQISVNATNLFFDLLLAQASLEIAEKNLANNDTIYKIAEGRYNLGKVSEGELLQLELTLMRAQQQVAEANLDMETRSLRLKSYIGLNESENIVLIPPAEIPEIEVDVNVALQEAFNNRQSAVAFERQKLEAERDLAMARHNSGLDASFSANIGLSNQGLRLPSVYDSPQGQQALELEFSIPIVDWGRQKSRIKTAEANQQLVEYTVAQDQINFEQEIFTQVRLFEMLFHQVAIAEKSDDIAQRRYELSKNRYLIGKISITDLNIAMQEKDEARRDYVAALDEYWTAYYTLRQMTLYDFEQNIPIIPD